MIHTQVPALDRTVHQTNEWLNGIQERLDVDTLHAFRALRATLQVLRDRLPLDEAAQLAAQLPTLLRGVFWEAWRPASKPPAIRGREEFLLVMAEALGDQTMDAEQTVRAVFAELSRRVSAGEIADVLAALPAPIRELWDAPVA